MAARHSVQSLQGYPSGSSDSQPTYYLNTLFIGCLSRGEAANQRTEPRKSKAHWVQTEVGWQAELKGGHQNSTAWMAPRND